MQLKMASVRFGLKGFALFYVLASAVGVFCGSRALARFTHPPSDPSHRHPKAQPAQALTLHQIVEEYTESVKSLDPYYGPYFGVQKYLDQFGDYPSPAFRRRHEKVLQTTRARLKRLSPSLRHTWTQGDRVLYQLLSSEVQALWELSRFEPDWLDFGPMGNRLATYLDDSSLELTSFPFDTVAHYEAFVRRSAGLKAYVDHQIDLLKQAAAQHRTLNRKIALRVPLTYQAALETQIDQNPFYRPVIKMPTNFSDADKERLRRAFVQMIQQNILPQYQRFDEFYRKVYIPHCRIEGFGIGSLPRGPAWYQAEIFRQTGLSDTPERIYQLGLVEVARIEKELQKLQAELNVPGSLRDFIAGRVKDPKNAYQSAGELLADFLSFKTAVAQKVPLFFSRMPQTDYRIFEQSNPEDAAASYNPPSEVVPFGRFLINAHNLKAISRDRLRTLSLHEASPGHHFQLALQFEMKGELTEFQRKIYQCNAFSEGWGLYAESLGSEMGLMSEPGARFGNLMDDLMRAVRLVVDTGIHYHNWSQEEALAYMREKLAGDENDMANEVNRYAVMPAQALSYKLGQLKIIELRYRAQSQLGPSFNVKGFHAAVLGYGTLSLAALEMVITEWIKSQKRLPTDPAS